MNTLERLNYKTKDFKVIQAMMYRHAGINLHDGKQELVYSRLAKRVRMLGFNNFSDYCSRLSEDSEEVLHCINSMTTNVTSFFRERHHFEFLAKNILSKPDKRSLRIWSAGCSSGEEPYSIAFTCAGFPHVSPEIVATDLDSDIIRKASNGVYQMKDVNGLSDLELKSWFLRGRGKREGLVRVIDSFRQMVKYSQLNLKENWQHDEPFDVIFCRNVMIYFDSEFRSRLIDRFHHHLKPGGHLILGHSESLFGLSQKFRVAGKTIHQKLGEVAA